MDEARRTTQEGAETWEEDDVVARRARIEDWEGILDINRHVYKGHDYMASNFYCTMHDPRYLPIVVLVRGKIVSFGGRFFINENTTYGYGGRTKPGYEGKGLQEKARSLFNSYHPALKYRTWAGIGSPRQDLFLKQSKTATILNKWDVFLAETSTDQFKDRVLQFKLAENDSTTSTAKLLSYQESLAISHDVPRFLQSMNYSYIFDMLPITPLDITGANIRGCMKRNNCVASLDPDGKLEAMSIFKSTCCGTTSNILHCGILIYANSVTDCIEHSLIILRYLAGLCGPHTDVVSPFVHVSYDLRDEIREVLTTILGKPFELNDGRTDVTFVKLALSDN